MENILEKFLLELNNGQIYYATFSQFLDEYDSASLYIRSNYNLIISNIYYQHYVLLIDLMYKDHRLKNIMESNFLETIRHCPNPDFLCVILSIYLEEKNNKEKKDFLGSYFDKLLNVLPISNLFSLFKYKYLDSYFENKLNERILSNKKEFVKGFLVAHRVHRDLIDNDKYFDSLVDVIVLLIDELLKEYYIENEIHLGYTDIVFDEGYYGVVFMIGNKVLKVGDVEQYEIPNHRRILQPLVRVDISSLVPKDIHIPNCIEVSERVYTNGRISKDELYVVWKELYEDNILWTDVKKENVGRLFRPNKRYFSKELAEYGKVLGFNRELDNSKDVLRTGELVVIDRDFIYDLNTYDILDVDFWSDLAIEFERRYKKEKMIDQRSKSI